MLRVDSITKYFGGLTAVDSVTFEIPPGQKVAVMGPNGAGKTTLFNIISGFEQPSQGRVVFGEDDITGWKPHRLVRRGLSRSFQIPRPFAEMSVLENILVAVHHSSKGDRRSPEDEAWDVLSKVGLTHRAEMAAEVIPVGEAKRLELARVLATRPKCLLLDEPFGGLTSGEIEPLVDIIRSLEEEGRTVILVEHRLRQVLPLVDRVIVMDQGRCIADGPASDVVSNPTVLRAYFGERGVEDLGLS